MENSKTIENGNEKLWAKIPYDVFINHIIPYTYQKIDSNLLNDIQNFLRDYRIILNYYSFEMNEFFLIHDILVFLYQRRFETAPLRGDIVQSVTGNLVEVSSAERIEIFNGVISDEITIEFLNRNVMFKNLSLDKKYEYIQYFQSNLNSKVDQKNKFLLALMTPSERARFINQHIITEFEND